MEEQAKSFQEYIKDALLKAYKEYSEEVPVPVNIIDVEHHIRDIEDELISFGNLWRQFQRWEEEGDIDDFETHLINLVPTLLKKDPSKVMNYMIRMACSQFLTDFQSSGRDRTIKSLETFLSEYDFEWSC